MAFADSELDPEQTRQARLHVAGCAKCAGELAQIQRERSMLLPHRGTDTTDPELVEQSVAGLMAAIDACKKRSDPGRLRMRLRAGLETYLGAAAVSKLTTGTPDEELIPRANEILAAFLGRSAAASVIRRIQSGAGPSNRCAEAL
jgi:hypothetical protein